MKIKMTWIGLGLALLMLPLHAAQTLDVRYTVKNVAPLAHGYRADISIVVYNNSANAYVDVQLVPQNIHLVDNNGVDNTLTMNTLPATTFIRHNWTLNTAEPLNDSLTAHLYLLFNAVDNLGNPVSLPIRATREAP